MFGRLAVVAGKVGGEVGGVSGRVVVSGRVSRRSGVDGGVEYSTTAGARVGASVEAPAAGVEIPAGGKAYETMLYNHSKRNLSGFIHFHNHCTHLKQP